MAMRYWFTLLGVVIVLRAFRWLRKDGRAARRRIRQLPDAGMIGELVVIEGSDELPEGAVIAVPVEGVLGFNRTCDIVVPVSGVAAHHLDFSFREKTGLVLRPRFRMTCEVDGQLITHRSGSRKAPMLHGSRLRVGEALLRLRVFAGIDVEHHAALAPDDPPPSDPQLTPPEQPSWQPPMIAYPPPSGTVPPEQASQPVWQPPLVAYPPPPEHTQPLPVPPEPARADPTDLPPQDDPVFAPVTARHRRAGRRDRHEQA